MATCGVESRSAGLGSWTTALRNAALLSAALIGLGGCGGGSEQGPSLNVLRDEALREPDPTNRARKLIAVASQQVQASDTGGAEASLAAALAASVEIKDAANRAGVLNLAADGLANAGNSTDAKKQLRAARSTADEIEDPSTRIPYLARNAEIRVQRLDDVDGALDVLKDAEKVAGQIEDPAARVAGQTRVVAALHVAKASGDVERLAAVAIEGARGLDNARRKSESLADLAATLHKAGQTEQAAALFGESEAAAAAIDDANSRGHALVRLAGRRGASGDKATAAKHLEAAQATSEQVSDRALREELVKKIREAQGKL